MGCWFFKNTLARGVQKQTELCKRLGVLLDLVLTCYLFIEYIFLYNSVLESATGSKIALGQSLKGPYPLPCHGFALLHLLRQLFKKIGHSAGSLPDQRHIYLGPKTLESRRIKAASKRRCPSDYCNCFRDQLSETQGGWLIARNWTRNIT